MMMMNKDMLFHHQQQQQQQQVIAEENMSNLTSASGDQASVSSGNRSEASGSNFVINPQQQQYFVLQPEAQTSQPPKKKRNQPGNPDPDAEVIALSPGTLQARNRFICEICSKGFQRDQNLQLHRRGHNLPWKLKQRSKTEAIRKKVYVCPEPSCVHHDPSRALGDLTGIKKHFSRKHGEKRWKCDKCSKRYAVQSDWKAHSKICGTKEYRCDCGTLFSRRDSFITHRAFCDALAEESVRSIQTQQPNTPLIQSPRHQTPPNNASSSSSSQNLISLHIQSLGSYGARNNGSSSSSTCSNNNNPHAFPMKKEQQSDVNQIMIPHWLSPSNPNPNPSGCGFFPFGSATATAACFHHPSPPSPAMSATALLQKAAQMGATNSAPSPTDVVRSSHNLTTTMASMMTSSATPPPGFGFAGGNSDNPSMFQDYNSMDSAAGFGRGEAFEESFGGFLGTSAAAGVAVPVAGEKNGGGGVGEGLTRDFLGLRPLYHSDILSFAGLGDCLDGNASEEHSHSQNLWQS
ncbi:PREDICTED: protein indeterminate-domain 11-like isoform X1 [Tarenaya hassleriana]|uniref:protein indeterminate-domain 11-like isoform X1 n=1 Tax=Tarenaya hassleriana TaxID=28532 RepID=UPI00053C8C76|nr:PREDICTED: protein indeterminate-domain 11-like isoform X1 [Tarenaya hassleriana]XP_010542423.1 PREDICTED: protein indeterminate-domain 11-like isoform X2 [Tarenaya hassleriana]XP_019058303.1 PREDICTED: protein indeterminate-domain 11-like isoform X1 [Tarenaya hassleriana]